jgi:hypothetical protein
MGLNWSTLKCPTKSRKYFRGHGHKYNRYTRKTVGGSHAGEVVGYDIHNANNYSKVPDSQAITGSGGVYGFDGYQSGKYITGGKRKRRRTMSRSYSKYGGNKCHKCYHRHTGKCKH